MRTRLLLMIWVCLAISTITVQAVITDVFILPEEPTITDAISILVSGGEGYNVSITDSILIIDETSIELDIYLHLGLLPVATPWSHSEDIGLLSAGIYELTANTIFESEPHLNDSYYTTFEVVPEPSLTVTRYVPSEYPTIQAAIDDCNDGDIVIVEPGIYTGPGNRDIDFLGRAITVRSVDPNSPDCVDATIIDCQGTEAELHRGFYFHSGEGADSVLEGFTITNGCAYKGGGIYCRFSSSPTIDNCIIRNNVAPLAPGFPWYIATSGGGIYCSSSSPIISNCQFLDNTAAGNGGAIYSYDSSALVSNCVITGNQASFSGGGGIGLHQDNISVHNCVITGNTASNGAGIRSNRSTPTISNCTISGNSAENFGGGMYILGGDATLTDVILWNNTAPEGPEISLIYSGFGPASLTISYSDVESGVAGIYVAPDCMLNWHASNINLEPYFAQPGYWDPNGTLTNPSDDFWVDGDYHLLPVSPCIDTGDPNYIAEPDETDLDGNERIINGIVDMGAYEANPIEAKLRMLPRVINRRGRTRYIIAVVRLPRGVEQNDIESDEPLTLYPGEIEAKRQYILGGRGQGESNVRVLGFFDKADFTAAVPKNGRVEVDVVGRVKTGRYFYGTDEIRVIGGRNGRSRRK
jgi:predicted outer membrane repeat protein